MCRVVSVELVLGSSLLYRICRTKSWVDVYYVVSVELVLGQ